jgi:hypothetical protein
VVARYPLLNPDSRFSWISITHGQPDCCAPRSLVRAQRASVLEPVNAGKPEGPSRGECALLPARASVRKYELVGCDEYGCALRDRSLSDYSPA